jgi:hypothetical protein
MSIFDDLFGGPKTTKTVDIPASQQAEMDAYSKYKTQQLLPYIQRGMQGAEDIYKINAPGMERAAQNVGGIAGQIQETAGGVGESALRSGTNFYQSLFDPRYEAQQIQAALQPAQNQYMQNVRQTGLNALRGGTANSSRQAMLNRMSANAARAQQAGLAAQVAGRVRGEQMQGAGALTQTGFGGLDRSLAAAQAKQAAANSNTDQYYKNLAARYSLAPTLGTTPYPGQVGTEEQKGADWNDLIGKVLPFATPFFSDVRLKENIKHVKDVDGIKVYTYNYVWDKEPQLGAMAQDLLNTKYADAVSVHSSGYYQVDYTKLPELI